MSAFSVAPATAAAANMMFGIYPGGPAGGATGSNPDNVSEDVAAVKQLDSSGAPFVVHLYAEYYGPGSYSASQEIGSEVQAFANAGIQVELVECYRPTDKTAATDVPGFVSWTQSTLKSLGSSISYLQVTNESNVAGDPTSNDGSFPGSEDALIQGVEAAHTYVATHGQQIKVGFNWSYNTGSSSWWSYLKTNGGTVFAGDLDWVGVDVYPGTWQSLPTTMTFGDGVSQVMLQAVNSTRSTYMPLAGLDATIPIQITETGYPTGTGRTTTDQETALESEVNAVNSVHVTDNVTAFQFFDLRDAITDNPNFNDQYGLMTDQWVPKPAFADYENLISTLGGAPASTVGSGTSGTGSTSAGGSTTSGGGTTTTSSGSGSSTKGSKGSKSTSAVVVKHAHATRAKHRRAKHHRHSHHRRHARRHRHSRHRS